MSAIEKAAAMPRQEAEGLKASHTLRGDWCGDPAEAEYHKMIAAADAAIAERDALRAKIERMERQEPVAWIRDRDNHRRRKLSFEKPAKSSPDKLHWSPLGILPVAQPAPSVPDGWKLVPLEPTAKIRKAMHYAYWQRQSPQMPYHDGLSEFWSAAYAAMLAAAPEAKP